MARLTVLFLAIFSCVHAYPKTPVRNTIFIDEKLEGKIFEGIDAITTNDLSNNPIDWRLPTTTRPRHYNLNLNINMQAQTYTGEIEIQLVATEANVNQIVLHAHELNIEAVYLQQETNVLPTTVTIDTDYQFMRVQLTTGTLQYNANNPVVYSLVITFANNLRTDMTGLYRSWFRNNHADQVSWIATTHFQATGARLAFPCYDEPSFKATFDITVTRPVTYRSWSCTRLQEIRTSTQQGYEVDVFSRTPVMSTYLLALIVAEYESTSIVENQLLKFEVIGRPAALASNQHEYAFHVAQDIMTTMNEYTGIDFYSMHETLKVTHAAIPDFSAGAMENWGLMIYREAYLMYDPVHTNDNLKQLIAYILSHEIAHMWFGNLVTCEYWDNLWLNEGFARYYQYYLTGWVEDYMGFDTRFITEQVHTALLSDSSSNPLPLTYPHLTSPASVRANMFSVITYNKGASILRMTEHLLGFETHRRGLQYYLQDRAYDVARPLDLFQALETAARETGSYPDNISLIDYFKSWTEKAGHPILNVNIDHVRGIISLSQVRFDINFGTSSHGTEYIIPLTFATADNPNFVNTKPDIIMTSKELTMLVTKSFNSWVIFNIQQTGFYRVNYDDYSWDLIIMALRSDSRTQIHEYNRAQIVNDVFQFARSGLMTYTRAFNILSYLQNEMDYAPWVAALTGFQWLRNRLIGTPHGTELDNMIIQWATPLMARLTYNPVPGETFMTSYLRWQLAPFMCDLNDVACRRNANDQFRPLLENNIEIPANNRNWVYCNGLREGTESDFNYLWQRYIQHNVYTEKILLLQVLGCTPHAASLNLFLTNIVEDNHVIRRQDYNTAFNSALGGNEVNTQIVFEFIKNNLNAVANAFGSVATPLASVAARLRTVQQIDEFEAWATQNQNILGDAYSTIYNSALSARSSIEWANMIHDDLEDYFTNGDTEITIPTTTPMIQTTTASVETTITTDETTVTTETTPAIETTVTTIEETPETTITTIEETTITDSDETEPAEATTEPSIEITTEAPDSAMTAVLSMIALLVSVTANVVLNY